MEEKVHLVLKMMYEAGGGLRLPLLNFVEWFHQKIIPMEYLIPIYLLPKLLLSIGVGVVG